MLVCALAPLIGVGFAVEAASAAGPLCGSDVPRRPDGTRYVCRFADDFDGTALDRSKWIVQQTELTGHTFSRDCWVDRPGNIAVSGGTLKLTSRQESVPFRCVSPRKDFRTTYTSGSVSTQGKFAQTYGRFEFRAKFPDARVKGSQGALWLYPAEQTYGGWPSSGEIDVAEFYSRYPDRAIPYIHYHRDITHLSPLTNRRCMIVNPAEFHTYTLQWTPSAMAISYDGATCLVHKIRAAPPLLGSQPFDRPFAIYLSQVLGMNTNAFKPGKTPLPLTTEIDWVRVWQ
jgi:beta-glucanase (GH16 family)